MLEQTQFPFSTQTDICGIENVNVHSKSYKFPTTLIVVSLVASIVGGIYYLKLKSDGLQKDKSQQ